jgi:hypothetical protein
MDLGSINWEALETANGTAEAVPSLIETLRAGTSKARHEAIEELECELVDDGFRYPASAAVVSLVAPLLGSLDGKSLTSALRLFTTIAVGWPTKVSYQVAARPVSWAPTTLSAIAGMRYAVESRCYLAVEAALPQVLPLLQHKSLGCGSIITAMFTHT